MKMETQITETEKTLSERFLEITNKVYEEEYDEFMDGYRQAAREKAEA